MSGAVGDRREAGKVKGQEVLSFTSRCSLREPLTNARCLGTLPRGQRSVRAGKERVCVWPAGGGFIPPATFKRKKRGGEGVGV
jgi:hypothetical protein